MKRTRKELLEAIPKLSNQSKDYILAQMLGVARAADDDGTVYGEVIFEIFNEFIDKEEVKNETT